MGVINKNGALYFATGFDNSGLYKDSEEAKRILGSFTDHAKKVGLAIGTIFGASQLKRFGAEIVNVRAEMEMLDASFETLIGSGGYRKFVDEMKSFAIESPLSMMGVSKAAQTLLGFNVDAEKVLPILRQLGDISMGNEDRFRSLALAFAQMSAAGRLMGQDLLQMINAGFNPLQEISAKTGKSISVLKKEMESGAISSNMVAEAFRSATAEGGKFYGMTQKQAEGIRGLQNQLQGGLQEAFNKIGASQDGLITSGYKGAISLVENYEKIGKTLIELVGLYGLVKAAESSWRAYNNMYGTAKYIEEAKGLETLLSVEQKAYISKKGLTKGTLDHAVAVNALATSNINASKAQVAAMGQEASLLKKNMDAAKLRAAAAAELVAKRRDEIKIIEESGKKTGLAAAQKKLDTAITRENTAITQKNAAMKAFYSQKAAIQTASQKAATLSTIADTAVQRANVNITNVLALAKIRLSAAMAKLNAVMAANKFTIVATAVAALGYGIYKLITYQTDAEKAQKRLNKTVEEFETAASTETTRLEIMFNRLKRATEGTEEYESAKQAIINQYGEYNSNLAKEMENVNSLTSVYMKLRDAVIESAKARSMQSATDNAAEAFSKTETKSKNEILKLLEKQYGQVQAEEYFSQIRQYIEGSSKTLSGELQKVISEFDRTQFQQSSTVGTSTSFTTNELQQQIDKIRNAAKIRDEEIRKAGLKFGELPGGSTTGTTTEEMEDLAEVIKNTSTEVDYLTKKLKNLRSGAAPSTDYKKEIEDTSKALEEARKSLDLLTGASEKSGADKRVEAKDDADKILLSLERENQQRLLNIMSDGTAKKLQQIESDYQLEIDKINEQEKLIRDAQGGNLTKRQEEEISKSRELALLGANKQKSEITKQEIADERLKNEEIKKSWNEYYQAYGTYQEKKLAITEDYSKRIADAEGNLGAQKILEKERDQALKDLELSMVEQSDLWIRLFSDTDKMASDSISKIINETEQLLDYLQGVEGAEMPVGFSEESLEALKGDSEKIKALLDSLKQKRDDLNRRRPFENLIQGFKDLKNAAGDADKEMAATDKIIQGFSDLTTVVNQLGNAFTGISPEFDKTVGDITSLMGDTASLATTGMQLGGPIGAAIGGALGLGSGLMKMFGGAKELSEQTVKSYEAYISTIDELIGKQKELIQSATGEEAIIEAEKAIKLIEDSIKATRQLGKDYFNSGAGWFSHSHGYKMKEAMEPFSKELKKIGIDLDSLGGRAEGLFDLSADRILKLKEQIPLLWAKLDESTRKYLQAVIDGDSEMQELLKVTQEAVTGLTFDSAKDSLRSLLLDADSTFEDIADKFEDYMRNSIMDLVMDGTMKKRLENWYKDYVSAMSDNNLSKSDIDSLQKEYSSIVEEAIKERDQLLNAAGLSIEKKDVSGVTGELQAQMTEGTGSQLVGLWNMTAMDTREIKEYLKNNPIPDVAKELSTLQNELAAINRNTRETADNTGYNEVGFKNLEEKLDKIERNTKQNMSRG